VYFEIVEKSVFFGPRLLDGGCTPDFGLVFSNRTQFQVRVVDFHSASSEGS